MYGKFVSTSAVVVFQIFRIKKISHPRFFTCIFFIYATFVKKLVQMVENCSQGEIFVKGGWQFPRYYARHFETKRN